MSFDGENGAKIITFVSSKSSLFVCRMRRPLATHQVHSEDFLDRAYDQADPSLC